MKSQFFTGKEITITINGVTLEGTFELRKAPKRRLASKFMRALQDDVPADSVWDPENVFEVK
jgi:hypothetical protein